jgi:hypothetical protein
MTIEPGVRVVRRPYEEPNLTHLTVAASNGSFTGETDLYCAVDDLNEIGEALIKFPTKVPDEYEFVYGSANPADRFYRFFLIRAKTVDMAGHCALHFEFDLNQEEPNEGRAAFSLRVEPWALAALGHRFLELHGDPTGDFRWSPDRKHGSDSAAV